jgi:hypothetical protein
MVPHQTEIEEEDEPNIEDQQHQPQQEEPESEHQEKTVYTCVFFLF